MRPLSVLAAVLALLTALVMAPVPVVAEPETRPQPSAGADTTAPPLSLAGAVEIALRQNPSIAAAGHDLKAAEAGVERARAGYLPRLDLGESYARSDNPVFAFSSKLNQGRFTASDFDTSRLNSPGAIGNFRTSVTLTQPLWTGGRTTAALEGAQVGRAAAALGVERQRQEVIFGVAQAYYRVLLAQANLDVVKAGLRAAEANRDRARVRFETGIVVESDVLSAEVRMAGLREQEIAAASQLTLARAALNDAMGRPLDEAFAATDALVERPLPAAAAAVAEQGTTAVPALLERRPDYRKLVEDERAAERRVALARAEFLPTVNARGSYDIDRLDFAANGQDSWFLGVALQWNLFNGLGDRARLAEARAGADRARALRARAASAMQLEVTDALLALRAARERIAVARRAAAQAKESLRLVGDRYGAGLTTIVDLLGAEAALTQARASVSAALHDHGIGVARLELAMGTIAVESFR